MPLNFLLFLIIPGLTVPYFLEVAPPEILIASGLFYILMIVECSFSKTNAFLSNLSDGEHIFSEINQNRTQAAQILYHV